MKLIIKIIQGLAGLVFLFLTIINLMATDGTIAVSVICGILALILLIPALKKDKSGSSEPTKSVAAESNVAEIKTMANPADEPVGTPPESSDKPSIEAPVTEGPAYPEDGITDTLDGLNPEVWDRGYYHTTSEGTWYEVYVTDAIKDCFHDMSLDHEDFEQLNSYACINLDHYQDDNQITFFVRDGEEQFTLSELTEFLI